MDNKRQGEKTTGGSSLAKPGLEMLHQGGELDTPFVRSGEKHRLFTEFLAPEPEGAAAGLAPQEKAKCKNVVTRYGASVIIAADSNCGAENPDNWPGRGVKIISPIQKGNSTGNSLIHCSTLKNKFGRQS